MMCAPPSAPAQGEPSTAVIPPSAKAMGPGRYVVSSSGAGQMAPNGKMDFVCSAYIVDSQTGEVFFVVKDEEPRLIGSVAKKK
jgi:hypothetical protein